MITILKASGEREPFSEEKYRASLKRSGLSDTEIEEVVNTIIPTIQEGMTTHDIYKATYAFIKKYTLRCAGRYNLKQALFDFGPTGHPFETFVGALLRAQGYSVDLRVVLAGKCVDHEVDALVKKEGVCTLVECKFHVSHGPRSNVKTSLYVKARLDDVNGKHHICDKALLITNTKFTTQAIAYGECVGMHLIGWSYPRGNGLERMIDATGLHPITSLSTLKKHEMRTLISHGLVVCQDVILRRNELARVGVKNIDQVVSEAEELSRCSHE